MRMFFLTFSNANSPFRAKRSILKSYITNEILVIAKQVKLIDKHEFALEILNKNSQKFVVHVPAFETPKLTMFIDFQQAFMLATL